jgi:hypothetical protein
MGPCYDWRDLAVTAPNRPPSTQDLEKEMDELRREVAELKRRLDRVDGIKDPGPTEKSNS